MAKFLLKTLRSTCIAVVAGAFLMPLSLAQGGGGGGNKGGSPSGNTQGAGQPAGNNQGSGQPGNNQTANSPGITSGSMAIESTLFAYKALAEDADKISAAVKGKVNSHAVVIATPTDFANLVQWRTTVYQAGLLHDRATAATQALNNIQKPNFFVNVPKNVPKLGAFLASAADLQTLVQTVASIFAVNETLSVSSGSLTSTPLTSLLADKLHHEGVAVYVPSVYPPNLLRRDDLKDTFIGTRLKQLEDDRQAAVSAGQDYSQALADAQTVLSSGQPSTAPTITNLSPMSGPIGTSVTIRGSNFGLAQGSSIVRFRDIVATATNWGPSTIAVTVPAGATNGPVTVSIGNQTSNGVSFTLAAVAGPPVPPVAAPPATPAVQVFAAPQKLEAAAFVAAATLKVAAVSSVVTAIDTFETTLVAGQSSSAPAQNNQGGSQQPTGNNPPGAPAPSPAPPVQGGGNNQSGGNNPNTPAPSSPNPAGSPLQQILPSDLLAHQIWNGVESPTDAELGKLFILIVQTLESGGNQLTKSHLFLGSRIYFNGGAVATFGLYGIDGGLQCGGYAYAYGGYAKDNDFDKALTKYKAHPIAEIESSCQP